MTVLAEELVARVPRLRAVARRKSDEYERIRSVVESVTQDLSPRESRSVPMVSDRTGDNIVRMMEARDRAAAAWREWEDAAMECSAALDMLDDAVHAEVLSRRYISEQEWDRIADEMGYTYHHVLKSFAK